MPFSEGGGYTPPQIVADSKINPPPDMENKSERERVVLEKFRDPNRHYIIVEDDLRESDTLKKNLKEKRGVPAENEDGSIIQVINEQAAVEALSKFLENAKGGEILTSINDCEIPNKESGRADAWSGIRFMQESVKRVEEWNQSHLELEPVELQIIINSLFAANEAQYNGIDPKNIAGPKVAKYVIAVSMPKEDGSSPFDKQNAIVILEEHFESTN